MPVPYTIRPAEPADAAAVTELLRAAYPAQMRDSYHETVLAAALPFMTRANPGLLNSGSFYLAGTQQGEIIGCGGWTRARPGTGEIEPGLAHIRHFGTHPDWARRGVGKAIYQRCETHARSAGVCRFECYAGLNAENFYRALGFSTIRQLDIPMAEDVALPSLLMTRGI